MIAIVHKGILKLRGTEYIRMGLDVKPHELDEVVDQLQELRLAEVRELGLSALFDLSSDALLPPEELDRAHDVYA